MKRILSTPAAMARPLMTRVHRILGLPLPAEDNRSAGGIAGAILLTLLAVTPLVFYFSQTGAAKPQTLQISPTRVAPAANPPLVPQLGLPVPANAPMEMQATAPMEQPSPAFMVGPPNVPMATPAATAPQVISARIVEANPPVPVPQIPGTAPQAPTLTPNPNLASSVEFPAARPGAVYVEKTVPTPNAPVYAPGAAPQVFSPSQIEQRFNATQQTRTSPTRGGMIFRAAPENGTVTLAKSPNVIRVYSLKEMLGGTYNDSTQAMVLLISNIIEGQLSSECSEQDFRIYDVAGKPALIIAAPQPVHDAVGGLLDSLKEVCETLKKLDGETHETPDRPVKVDRIVSDVAIGVAPYQPVDEVYPEPKPTPEVDRPHFEIIREPVEQPRAKIADVLEARFEEGESAPEKPSLPDSVQAQVHEQLERATEQIRTQIETFDRDVQDANARKQAEASSVPTNPQWAKIEETEKKLETNVRLDSDGSMTLREAVELLQEQTGQFIAIDEKALEDAEATPESMLRPIRNSDAPASLVLNRILKPLNLIYTINEDGDVVITTKDGEERVSSLIQVYDVRKYCPTYDEIPPPMRLSNGTMEIVQTLDKALGLDESQLMPLNGAICAKTTYRNQKEIQKILASLPVVVE